MGSPLFIILNFRSSSPSVGNPHTLHFFHFHRQLRGKPVCYHPPCYAITMPKDKEVRGARQRIERPVSCRFCRSRKLRCSREAPCSNCVARGIVCQLPVENIIRSTANNVAPSDNQPELLERIRKLEEIVESQKSQTNGNAVRYPQQSPESPESSGTPYTLRTNTSRSTLSPDIENLDNDVAFLKSIYTAQNLSVSTQVPLIVCLDSDLMRILPG